MFGLTSWVDIVVVMLTLILVWQKRDHSLMYILSDFVSWVVGWGVMWKGHIVFWHSLVKHFGVSRELSQFVAPIVLLVLIQGVLFRAAEILFPKVKRQYFSGWWQSMLTFVPIVAAAYATVMAVLLLLITIPYHYPLQDELLTSWSAQLLLQFLGRM